MSTTTHAAPARRRPGLKARHLHFIALGSAIGTGLFYGVGYWNAFFNAMLYVNDQELWPIQLILRSYVIQGTSMTADQLGVQQTAAPQSIKMAVVVVALVPILLVYPFLQKYFSKGVITGAIKG